jgi:hypothetical protein
MTVRRRALAVAAVLVVTVAATACSNAGGTRNLDLSASVSPSSDAGTGSVQEWIAVFRMEADPHDMSNETADVLSIVGGSIVVSPVACFEGLPTDFRLDAYLLGVVARTKDALDEVVARVGRTAIFEGQVRTMCLD